MLSLSQLLLILFIILALWYGSRVVSRIERGLRREDEVPRKARRGGPRDGARIEAEDMVECRVCGVYVAATGARACGRPDCPYA